MADFRLGPTLGRGFYSKLSWENVYHCIIYYNRATCRMQMQFPFFCTYAIMRLYCVGYDNIMRTCQVAKRPKPHLSQRVQRRTSYHIIQSDCVRLQVGLTGVRLLACHSITLRLKRNSHILSYFTYPSKTSYHNLPITTE